MSYSDSSGLLLIDVHALTDEFMLADGLGIEVRAMPQALHMLFFIDVPHWLLGQGGFALAAALDVRAQRCLVGREHRSAKGQAKKALNFLPVPTEDPHRGLPR
jgi:hypothetical protein